MSTRLAGLVPLAVAALVVPGLSAQDFEGVIQQRSISVSSEALYTVLNDAEIDDAILDGDDEQAYLRALTEVVFETPLERFTEMAAYGEDVTVEEMAIHVKGSRMSVEAGGGMGFDRFIVDAGTGTMWMVSSQRQMFVEWTQEDLEAMQRQSQESLAALGIDMDDLAGQADGPEAAATIAPLGRTEEVNGVTATAYRASSGDEIAVAWIRDDDPGIRESFRLLSERMAAMGGDGESGGGPSVSDLFWQEGTPVRTQTLQAAWGNLQGYDVEDILSVERTSVADDLFEVPAGFEKKSLQDLYR